MFLIWQKGNKFLGWVYAVIAILATISLITNPSEGAIYVIIGIALFALLSWYCFSPVSKRKNYEEEERNTFVEEENLNIPESKIQELESTSQVYYDEGVAVLQEPLLNNDISEESTKEIKKVLNNIKAAQEKYLRLKERHRYSNKQLRIRIYNDWLDYTGALAKFARLENQLNKESGSDFNIESQHLHEALIQTDEIEKRFDRLLSVPVM